MLTDIIDFYVFSGTGNTLIASEKLSEELRNAGYTVNLHRMEHSNPVDFDPSHTLGIAFPIIAFTAQSLVFDFIKNLPPVSKTPAFMICTMAGSSLAAPGQIKRLIKPLGYDTIGAAQITMPYNASKKIDNEENKAKISDGLSQVSDFARNLIAGESRWKRSPILSDLSYLILGCLMTPVITKSFSKKYGADPSKCNSCGICVDLCPVRNISMENGTPRFGDNCIVCTRCLNYCPENAILIGGKSRSQYKPLSLEEIMPEKELE